MIVRGKLTRKQHVEGDISVDELAELVRRFIAVPRDAHIRFFVQTQHGRHYLDEDPLCFDSNWTSEEREWVPDAPTTKQG